MAEEVIASLQPDTALARATDWSVQVYLIDAASRHPALDRADGPGPGAGPRLAASRCREADIAEVSSTSQVQINYRIARINVQMAGGNTKRGCPPDL
jgi:hypothetical protein